MVNHAMVKQLEGIDWSRVELRPRECRRCSRSCLTRTEAMIHAPCVRRSRRTDLYACARCPATFRKVSHFQGHVAAVHLKERTFRCNHCGKRYSGLSSLVKHLKRIHYGSRCRQSGCRRRTFSCARLMQQHREQHERQQLQQQQAASNPAPAAAGDEAEGEGESAPCHPATKL